MKVICTRCGGTNIACEAIVNPNTGKIIDYLDESFMHANCGDCKEEVVITDVDRVKKDIDSMFFEFVKKNGKEPEYAECQIVWKDTGDDQRTTIKLGQIVPFIGLRIGYAIDVTSDYGGNGFYCNPFVGVKYMLGKQSAVNFSLGYGSQARRYSFRGHSSSKSIDGFNFKIGIEF